MEKNVWWDKEVQEAVCEKKKLWLVWLATRANQRNHTASFDEVGEAKKDYRRMKVLVKELVDRKKDEQKDKMEERLSRDFQANIKFFWKSVRLARGNTQNSELKSIKDKNGRLVNEEECILKRWKEYFESLFDKEEANTSISKLNESIENVSEDDSIIMD
ncbi:uncharacterized protein LOC134741769 [Cydia strobilella]|uniref:uncharacterized protein LOC134741769 n=1 Tax=Cydia strobilella TaxID=1100964 RepID=UPI0030071A98